MAGRNRSGGARARRQRGFTMLEILITLFLLTMWLLASAGVQSSSLQLTKAAQFRTQAVNLATELAERMQANPAAAVAGRYAPNGSYTYSASGGAATLPSNCTTQLCSSDDLAAFDLAEWSNRVAVLPGATVSVSTGGVAMPANPVTYTIQVSWTDRRTSASGSAESFSYTATKTIFNSPSL